MLVKLGWMSALLWHPLPAFITTCFEGAGGLAEVWWAAALHSMVSGHCCTPGSPQRCFPGLWHLQQAKPTWKLHTPSSCAANSTRELWRAPTGHSSGLHGLREHVVGTGPGEKGGHHVPPQGPQPPPARTRGLNLRSTKGQRCSPPAPRCPYSLAWSSASTSLLSGSSSSRKVRQR